MPLRYEISGSKVPSLILAATAISAAAVHQQKHETNNSSHVSDQEHIRYIEDVQLRPAALVVHAVRRKRHHHLTPAQYAAKEVTPEEYRAWSKVNVCEEGGDWHVSGSTYSGGLGISNVNWTYYKERYHPHFPDSAANATPQEQIMVAMTIQKDPPDQNGCTGSW